MFRRISYVLFAALIALTLSSSAFAQNQGQRAGGQKPAAATKEDKDAKKAAAAKAKADAKAAKAKAKADAKAAKQTPKKK